MRYRPIDPALFVTNRKNLAGKLKPNSIVIVNANDIMPTSADGMHPLVQNSDLFYLCGIDQEETILLLYPDAREEKFREILFVRETSPQIAVWEGRKLSRDEARQRAGIQTVYWTGSFETVFRDLMVQADQVYLNTNEHLRADRTVETRDDRFIRRCRKTFPLHGYQRLAPLMRDLRMIKSQAEIDQIREACRITHRTFEKILTRVGPGVWEFEIEAEIYREFIRSRSRGPAFHSIIASGENTCVLHYVENDRKCCKDDLLLIDFGAEYAHYAADVTRTIPVSGRFTARQRQVYDAVLQIQQEAIQLLVPGNTFQAYNKAVAGIVETALIGLGLLDSSDKAAEGDENPPYQKYFMHGISHHLGLDVHDVSERYQTFAPGMVLTCEPGIYIPDEKIGVRIENDILITADGPEDLTRDIPVEADAIEEMMNP